MDNKASIKDLYFSFFRIGLFTFGGGLAMLPMLEKELVDKHGWCDEEEILNYYAVGQCTPGIIAVNVATFVGFKHGGVAGAIASTLGIISPSLIIITLIAAFLRNYATYPLVQKALKGLGAGVCAIIIPSIIKMAKSSITAWYLGLLSAAAFVIAVFTDIPIFIIVIFGILSGIFIGMRRSRHDLS
ncbi:MAG: chromate transporter [Erysipelotrichaceae bacterium]|nr:chromate transporter [Erysipelotrichaceae bacterium]